MPMKTLSMQRAASLLYVASLSTKVFVTPLLIATFYLLGCARLPGHCREFFKLSAEQQKAIFRTYPVEKQLDLYLCGMQVEPPDISFAYDIARGGQQHIPFLLDKLRTENYEPNKVHIIYIFRAMSVLGYLNGRHDVTEQIEHVISDMKLNQTKEQAKELLNEIRKDTDQTAVH